MKKQTLFLLAIVLMSQSLLASASPSPNPEPQFSILDVIFKTGSYLFNSSVYLVSSIVDFALKGLTYTVVEITQIVIKTITVAKAVLGNSFTALNTASVNAVKVINSLVDEFNQSVTDDLTIDPPGIVFGSSAIAGAGENVQAISCGIQHLASVFISMRAVSCKFEGSGIEAYPAPPATLPSQPNTTVIPVAVAISIQARYALQIIQRLNSDISNAVQKYEDIRSATGISCPLNCTLSRNLTNAYASISVILNAQINSTLINRLITVFNPIATVQVNDALMRTKQFIDCIRANAECSSTQIREYKNKPFVQLIDSLKNNSINATQYSSSALRIMKLTTDYSQLYIRNLFASLRSSKDNVFSRIEITRQSLISQVTLTAVALNNRANLIFDSILLPKITTLRAKLATIPQNMQLMFGNLTTQRIASPSTIEAALDVIYQNASLDVSKAVSNLTNLILSDASKTTSNCQSFLEQVQGLQAVFAIEAGNCTASAYQSTQTGNQIATTSQIADLFNELTSAADKCLRDNSILPVTWISYLATQDTRQTIANCLDTVIQKADTFIANASNLARSANNAVPTSADVAIANANECIALKTSQISAGVQVLEIGFNECKAGNAA